MTTKVTIENQEGYHHDVLVTTLSVPSKTVLATTRLGAGKKQEFYVHSSQELTVCEIKRQEVA